MSHSFKMGAMQTCLRSYMKHCHPIAKLTAPRECPPGPLQRLLAKKKSSLTMMRSNRSNRDIRRRALTSSSPIFSGSSARGGKDTDLADFDLVKFEPIMNKGDYWQVLVTLKRKGADGPRDRWLRHIRQRDSRSRLGAVSAIGLDNFYKDAGSPQKMKRLNVPNLLRYVKPVNRRLEIGRAQPKETIESISNLLKVATERILMRHNQLARMKFVGKAVAKINKECQDQSYTANEMATKLRKNKETKRTKDQEDKPLKAQIENRSRSLDPSSSSSSQAADSRKALRRCSSKNSFSEIKRLPKVHMKIQSSINLRRNSLGQLRGTSRTRISTTTPKNDGRLF